MMGSMRDAIFLIGRILFALIFLRFGIAHLTETEASAQYAAYKGVPRARFAVVATGVAMLVGGAAVVLGLWMDLAALGLAIFVLVAGVVMHDFWTQTDAQTRQVEMAAFYKNVSIAGGALILVAVSENAPYAITDGVF
jgi:putative oxidoreductase